MKPKISVVIPHLNQAEMLAKCLETVCNQTMPRSDYEVIVVDNGSANLPNDVCERYRAWLLQESEPGPGPARNKGIAVSSADLIAFIDSDCIADSNWLANAYAALSDPAVQIVGGDVRIAYLDPNNVTAIEAYESVFGYRQKLYIEKMNFSATLNMAFRKGTFEKVGPLSGISIAEDRDWGIRATKLGFKIVYLPTMTVYHPARISLEQLRIKWRRHVLHDFAEARVSKKLHILWYARTLAVALSPLVDGVKIIGSDRVSGFKQRITSFVILVYIRLFRSAFMINSARILSAEKKPSWNKSP